MPALNKDNILAVADAIEARTRVGIGFTMDYFIVERRYIAGAREIPPAEASKEEDCGTVACIAGWCNLMNGKSETTGTFRFASKWLGLAAAQHDELFFASNHPDWDENTEVLSAISAEQAVRTLRNLAETGKVDWTV